MARKPIPIGVLFRGADVAPAVPRPDPPPAGAPVPGLPVPTGDIRLQDGTLLVYRGPLTPPVPLHSWRGKQGLIVTASAEANIHGPMLHVAVSFPTHDPSWRLLALIKDAFFGDIDVGMILPRACDYTNVHPHCFHLWQLPVRWGIKWV